MMRWAEVDPLRSRSMWPKVARGLVAVYQIAGGLVGLGAVAGTMPRLLRQVPEGTELVAVAAFAAPTMMFAMSVAAGALVLGRTPLGQRLSVGAQAAQVLWFASPGLSYYCLMGVLIGVVRHAEGIEPVLRWGSVVVLSREASEPTVILGVNVVPIVLILTLQWTWRLRRTAPPPHR